MCYFEGRRENILPRRYVSGESHFYLGRRHMLKLKQDPQTESAIKLLFMKTQWGSCSPKGQLTLKKAPRECIDYVLLHELCHTAEHNHSENFYRLMKQTMPQWEKVKERLDGMAYYYLNYV